MHERFNFETLEQLKAAILEKGLDIPIKDDIDILKQPYQLGGHSLPNRMAIHPMEGCDGEEDGSPGELTIRRYNRFGAGGAGLLWFEACAVVHEGRANPRQLYLHDKNIDAFKNMLQQSLEHCKKRPYTVLQLTHSGRYSRPGGELPPIIATQNQYLDPYTRPGARIITDGQLEQLEDFYVTAAKLAKEVGFDAVDIKACHRYLVSELLSAHTREGKYGGSFENRTRFLLNVVEKIKQQVDISITSRMNVYDAISYPYGFGTDEEGGMCLDEPIELIKQLHGKGLDMISISAGNPYYNPHVGRPYDFGPYVPPSNQLEDTAALIKAVGAISKQVPECTVLGVGFTWQREFGANVAAGCIEKNVCQIAGFGRQAFAYPEFAADIIEKGGMVRSKCCIACSKCTEIMRDGGKTGCVIKDSAVYAPIYKQGRQGKQPIQSSVVNTHI